MNKLGILEKLDDLNSDLNSEMCKEESYGSWKIIDNNFGATLQFKIIDGRLNKMIKFCGHQTSLWCLFNGRAVTFGPEELIFHIEWDSVYLTNDKYCGINRPFYL